MYPFLLSLSLIATAIGVFAIGFGIPNRDFSLGDMLIIVGTVAIVGGMIMFGLAAAVRQLRRIADGMAPRPAARRPPVPEGADTAATARPAPAPRVPYPAKAATEAGDRDTRSTEPPPAPRPGGRRDRGIIGAAASEHSRGTRRGRDPDDGGARGSPACGHPGAVTGDRSWRPACGGARPRTEADPRRYQLPSEE